MARQANLTPVARVETFALIIRIGWCSDPTEELWRRGSWIGEGQVGREHWEAFCEEKRKG